MSTQRNNAGKLDLHHVLEQLAQQNINSVLLESGPKLIGAMVEAGLVDEHLLCPDAMEVFPSILMAILQVTKGSPVSMRLNAANTKIFNSGNTQRNNAGKLDLHHVLEQLAQQNINSVLLESGPKLIGAMAEAGLVDEFILYTAPLLMGSNATSMIQLTIQQMDECLALNIQDIASAHLANSICPMASSASLSHRLSCTLFFEVTCNDNSVINCEPPH
jgi:riboflavin biosynthesis pyrimidine reductase